MRFKELVNRVYPNSTRGVNPNLMSYFGEKRLNQINSLMIEEYKTVRLQSVSNCSVNRELAVIKHSYNQAILWELATKNPMRGVKLLPETPKDRWVTYTEEELILSASPIWLKPIILLDINTGLRLSELLNLTWDNIDLDRKTLTVAKSKNGCARTIPLNTLTYELLKVMESSGKIFNHSCSHVTHAMRRVCDKVGLKDVTFHSLRHTFGSRLAQCNVNVLAIQKLMGHKSITMSQRYCHQTVDSLRAIMLTVEDRICNQRVGGSNPSVGSIFSLAR
jgi:integrase